jgi:hypothetical protein
MAAWWPLLLCGLAGGILPQVMASSWMQGPCLNHTFVDPRLDAGVRHGSTCDHEVISVAHLQGMSGMRRGVPLVHMHAVAIIELCVGTSRKPCTWTPAASLSVRDSERLCAIPLAAAINGGCCSSRAGSSVSRIWMLLSTALVPCIASELESLHCAVL